MINDSKKLLLKELRDSTAYWVNGSGPMNHTVVSSRIRLARNIKEIPFPHRATEYQLKEVLQKSEKNIRGNNHFLNFKILKLDELEEIDICFLVEKRLISLLLAQFAKPFRALIYRTDESISVMINEEDHYRIQCMLPGFQLKKVWEMTENCDNRIAENIEYAFSKKYGYLTSCPTNVGTGLRASVMLHLPGLIISNQLNDLMNSISNQGFAIRGFYGEGTDFLGSLFQISNQYTLGLNEKEIIDKLETVTNNLVKKEQKAREDLIFHSKQKIEDQIMRAYGILINARIISTSEAVNLLSLVRFGIETGILVKVGYDTINKLMLVIQPAYLQLVNDKKMDKEERGSARATLIQELIK